MGDMIGQNVFVELSLGTVVTFEQFGVICGQQFRLFTAYLADVDLEINAELALHRYAGVYLMQST